MFVRAMSGIYIHKASNKYVILSLGLFLSLLYSYCAIQLSIFRGSAEKQDTYIYYFELGTFTDDSKKEKFIELFTGSCFGNNIIKQEFRDKEKAWARLSGELSLEFASIPIHDILMVSSNKQVDADQFQSYKEVSRWHTQKKENQKATVSLDGKSIILLPIILFSAVLYFNILYGAAASNLNTNKRVLESLIISGAHHNRLSAVFRRNGMMNFAMAFLLSILLFALSIYLIIYAFGLDLHHISLSEAFKSILIPSFVLFGIHLIVLLWKVDKYIKSI